MKCPTCLDLGLYLVGLGTFAQDGLVKIVACQNCETGRRQLAQLTQEDVQTLKSKGLYAKEKCDRSGCGHVISYVAWVGRNGKRYCSKVCRDMDSPRESTRREASELRTQKGGERRIREASEAAPTRVKDIALTVLGMLRKERKGGWKIATLVEAVAPTIPDLDAEKKVKRAIRRLVRKGKAAKSDDGVYLRPTGVGVKSKKKK